MDSDWAFWEFKVPGSLFQLRHMPQQQQKQQAFFLSEAQSVGCGAVLRCVGAAGSYPTKPQQPQQDQMF